MRYVNGYDDKEIVAGAGTIGMEILEQVWRLGGGKWVGRQASRQERAKRRIAIKMAVKK